MSYFREPFENFNEILNYSKKLHYENMLENIALNSDPYSIHIENNGVSC